MVQLTAKTQYAAKDQKKADLANKFIGRGSVRSSTNQYRVDYGAMANCGDYVAGRDIIFISAEGDRLGRIDPDFAEISKALNAGITVITDNPASRNRSYNIGERQVALFLLEHGYVESAHPTHSIWNPESLL